MMAGAMAFRSRVRLRSRLVRLRDRLLPPVVGVARDPATDRAAVVPFGYALSGVAAPSRPIGIICHIFHEDLAGEMRDLIGNVPFPADLHLSTDTEAKRAVIARAFADWDRGSSEIRVVPNRGRDIAPKFVGFADAYARHDLVLFLHSKKSLTSPVGDQWRNTLTRSLVGTPDVVRSIVDVFGRHPEVGLVMCQHFEGIRPYLNWDGNYPAGRRLARRMGFRITPRHVLDLPSGSMFWARSAALRPLLDLGLRLAEFPPEENQVRGTLAHAIERVLLFVCERAGYRWIKVADPSMFRETAALETIPTPQSLAAFLRANRFDLLDAHLNVGAA